MKTESEQERPGPKEGRRCDPYNHPIPTDAGEQSSDWVQFSDGSYYCRHCDFAVG